VKTRAVFESLGFQEDWKAITDQRPAYYYDFGNLRLTAAEVMNDYLVPSFHFGGVWRDANSISMVDFVMPLDVESFEQAVAWIAYGIGERFRPSFPTPWLADGRALQSHLPWVRRMEKYRARPMCLVEKELRHPRLVREAMHDEEEHINYLETQLDLVAKLGLELYAQHHIGEVDDDHAD
jgi:hypothetical protein